MSKIDRWKKIFGSKSRQKVPVRVRGKTEQMTVTQSYRFSELKEQRETGAPAADRNPLQASAYGLQDASFRLFLSDEQLLQKAAAGFIRLYINARGLTGRWLRRNANGSTAESTVQTLTSGFLSLNAKSRRELADNGSTRVSVLEYVGSTDRATADIDSEMPAVMRALGADRILFCLQEPMAVARSEVVLLPPLVLSGSN